MSWSLLFDLLGTFFFAISGSLLAAGRGFDIVASLLLGGLTGLGGGITRDLILGVPPAAFAQPIHFAAPVAAALLVFLSVHGVQRFSRVLLTFDAGGLALFCTTGAVIALEAGMNPIGAIVLGLVTGCGGGLLRDVVGNRDPQLFNPNDLYAVPAFLGAALIVGAWLLDWYNTLTLTAIAVFVFAFRVLSLRFHWHIPRAAWAREGSG